MIQIDFHKLAEKELLYARDYYDELVFGLVKKFIVEIEYVLKRIRSNPLEFPVYFNKFRMALLRKFPFSIIFRNDHGRIYILAIVHQKRKPKYYVNRLD
ncbi:MAG: type II toxin-antitoxin system RelE/ParE family toxin [Melioribacteraceae bacterium]